MDFNFYEWVRDGVPKSALWETDEERELRTKAKAELGEMPLYTGDNGRSNRAFIDLAELAGGVAMQDEE